MKSVQSRWPKTPAPLSPQQEAAREAFMLAWHEELPDRYAFIEQFNHGALVDLPVTPLRFRTLEIGAGIGGHLPFEDLSRQDYYCLELRAEWCEILKNKPAVHEVYRGNIECRTPYAGGFFDRIVAIHVLEHLRNLPLALTEIDRLLAPAGIFDVVLPCEGGAAYWLARKISSEPMFQKRYGLAYRDIIANEHVNTVFEILPLLDTHFNVAKRKYFPIPLPILTTNLCVALRLQKR
jgi:SAM-dependent methyltransferase